MSIQIRTQFIDPIPSEMGEDFRLIKEFRQTDQIVKLFHNVCQPSALFYGAYNAKGALIQTDTPLELEGVPDLKQNVQMIPEFFRDTYGKISLEHRKLSVFQRGSGGGWGEMLVGSIFTVAGIAATFLGGPPIWVAVGSSAVIGGGLEMTFTGYSRDEDKFDSEFGFSAFKGACGGAVGGAIAGGLGGRIIQSAGANTVFAKQSIHAATNAASGIIRNTTEAGVDFCFGGEEGEKRAREKMSARNLAASAAGGAIGGLAGAHAGKQASKISDKFTRTAARIIGSAAAGGAAGAAAGGGAAATVNAIQGKNLTEGLGSAMRNGAATGMITGSNAGSRVEAAHITRRFMQEQITQFNRNGSIELNREQGKELSSFLEKKWKEAHQQLRNTPSGRYTEVESKLHKEIDRIGYLKIQVKHGVLERNAVEALNELNGLSTLNNPELQNAIQQKAELRASQARKVVPPKSSLKEATIADPVKKRLSPFEEAFERVKPQQPEKTGNPFNREKIIKQLLSTNQKKMGAIAEQFSDIPIDPNSKNLVGDLIGRYENTQQVLLNPHGAAEEVLQKASQIKNNQFFTTTPKNSLIPDSVIYRNGSQIFYLQGAEAQKFLEQTALGQKFEVQGQRFFIDHAARKGEFFSQLVENFQEAQNNLIESAKKAAQPVQADPLLNPISLFTSTEIRRIKSILKAIYNRIAEVDAEPLVQDLYQGNGDLANNLANLERL